MTTVDIACTSDNRYVPHLAAMLHSVRWHAPGLGLRVHFLCGTEPSASLRAKLAGMAGALEIDLRWVEVPAAMIQGLPSRDYLSPVVWYRIYLPQLLPDLGRVLYLDADVIAMESIAPLWEIPLGDALFGAVTNVVPDYYAHRAAELGLPGPADYFNLGVALWNLERMRAEGFTEAVLRYSRENLARLYWLEQDAVNALYWQRRRPLHPRWNAQNAIILGTWGTRLLDPEELRQTLEKPALLHFEGGSYGKPWHLLSTHPLREQYFFHRRRTPWPTVIPTGLTPINLAKRLKRALI